MGQCKSKLQVVELSGPEDNGHDEKVKKASKKKWRKSKGYSLTESVGGGSLSRCSSQADFINEREEPHGGAVLVSYSQNIKAETRVPLPRQAYSAAPHPRDEAKESKLSSESIKNVNTGTGTDGSLSPVDTWKGSSKSSRTETGTRNSESFRTVDTETGSIVSLAIVDSGTGSSKSNRTEDIRTGSNGSFRTADTGKGSYKSFGSADTGTESINSSWTKYTGSCKSSRTADIGMEFSKSSNIVDTGTDYSKSSIKADIETYSGKSSRTADIELDSSTSFRTADSETNFSKSFRTAAIGADSSKSSRTENTGTDSRKSSRINDAGTDSSKSSRTEDIWTDSSKSSSSLDAGTDSSFIAEIIGTENHAEIPVQSGKERRTVKVSTSCLEENTSCLEKELGELNVVPSPSFDLSFLQESSDASNSRTGTSSINSAKHVKTINIGPLSSNLASSKVIFTSTLSNKANQDDQHFDYLSDPKEKYLSCDKVPYDDIIDPQSAGSDPEKLQEITKQPMPDVIATSIRKNNDTYHSGSDKILTRDDEKSRYSDTAERMFYVDSSYIHSNGSSSHNAFLNKPNQRLAGGFSKLQLENESKDVKAESSQEPDTCRTKAGRSIKGLEVIKHVDYLKNQPEDNLESRTESDTKIHPYLGKVDRQMGGLLSESAVRNKRYKAEYIDDSGLERESHKERNLPQQCDQPCKEPWDNAYKRLGKIKKEANITKPENDIRKQTFTVNTKKLDISQKIKIKLDGPVKSANEKEESEFEHEAKVRKTCWVDTNVKKNDNVHESEAMNQTDLETTNIKQLDKKCIFETQNSEITNHEIVHKILNQKELLKPYSLSPNCSNGISETLFIETAIINEQLSPNQHTENTDRIADYQALSVKQHLQKIETIKPLPHTEYGNHKIQTEQEKLEIETHLVTDIRNNGCTEPTELKNQTPDPYIIITEKSAHQADPKVTKKIKNIESICEPLIEKTEKKQQDRQTALTQPNRDISEYYSPDTNIHNNILEDKKNITQSLSITKPDVELGTPLNIDQKEDKIMKYDEVSNVNCPQGNDENINRPVPAEYDVLYLLQEEIERFSNSGLGAARNRLKRQNSLADIYTECTREEHSESMEHVIEFPGEEDERCDLSRMERLGCAPPFPNWAKHRKTNILPSHYSELHFSPHSPELHSCTQSDCESRNSEEDSRIVTAEETWSYSSDRSRRNYDTIVNIARSRGSSVDQLDTDNVAAGVDTEPEEDGCYDSLEDLKRGKGLRKLPEIPATITDSLEDLSSISEGSRSTELGSRTLTRSMTFVSTTSNKARRKLPDIPFVRRVQPAAVAPAPELWNVRSVSCDSQNDHGFFSLSDERGSGYPSLDQFGEETCVDVPALLPKRNSSNFLWVELNDKDLCLRRRPKNHDRLSQAMRARHRHSAPPGTLPTPPLQKRSLPEKPDYSRMWDGSAHQEAGLSRKGRIHSAVVSGINVETKSVTVEWFERGETKGKEIELEQILDLNQDLAPQAYDNSNVIPNKQLKYTSRPTVAGAGAGAGRGRNKNIVRKSEIIPSNGHSKDEGMEPSMPPPKQVPSLPPEKSETVSKATGGAASKSLAADRRRSNVVKEVERLKENRERRRAQQAQILEEKEALRNIDPGNPNWEFLQMILDYKDQLEFNPLQDGDPLCDHQITVCVRKRPMSQKEVKKKEVDVVTCPNKDQVIIHEPKTKVDLTKYLESQQFRFDYAFDENADNELVYKYSARPLVQSIFDGGMATCFAYGQTGSGKTHTMGGEFQGKTQDSKGGIYAFATRDVFKLHKSPKYKNLNIGVNCSYFEIYSGKVFDLLSGKSKLRVLEDGKQQVVIVGLTEKEVDCVEDVLKLITHGNNIRTSGQTSANAHSSRSHAVFQIILRHNNNRKTLYGKFSLIDLAGNERGADTSSANRQTRMEGAEINKSLLALKECIRALGRKGAHLPFRASKLTQVLRDSFIGEKAKTCMIAMISPSLSSCEHTLNTLRYADRVKELGAADPVENRGKHPNMQYSYDEEEALSARMDDGVMSPEDSDLAQLRSLNDGECSADWYNFQESVAHLQLLEEEVVESHKNLVDSMNHWIGQDASLLAMSNEVDYDQDAYAQQLEDMIAEKQEVLAELREKTRAFRECLNEEEMRSKNLGPRRN